MGISGDGFRHEGGDRRLVEMPPTTQRVGNLVAHHLLTGWWGRHRPTGLTSVPRNVGLMRFMRLKCIYNAPERKLDLPRCQMGCWRGWEI